MNHWDEMRRELSAVVSGPASPMPPLTPPIGSNAAVGSPQLCHAAGFGRCPDRSKQAHVAIDEQDAIAEPQAHGDADHRGLGSLRGDVASPVVCPCTITLRSFL